MTEFRTKSGRVLTDADIYALADEAERGYDPAEFVRRVVPVYVPAEGRLTDVRRGSGIVGKPHEQDGYVVVYYEGNVYDFPSMKVYADRVLHAADRMGQQYPTVARAVVPAEDLIRIGEWDAATGRVTLDYDGSAADLDPEDNPIGLLDRWIGGLSPDQLRATTGPGSRLP